MNLAVKAVTVRSQHRDRAPWRKSKVRVFVFPAGETLLDNLVIGRLSRPVAAYRTALPAIFAAAGIDQGTKARWDQHAGCSMCPCSPGFVLDLKGRVDVFADVIGEAPELTPEQQALAAARFAQLGNDPTIPLETLVATVLS